MSRTLEPQEIPKGRKTRKPGQPRARRQAMSPVVVTLDEKILTLLQNAGGKALSMPEIERQLAELGQPVDTFKVTEAVWRLIDKRQADFTPRRHVKVMAP